MKSPDMLCFVFDDDGGSPSMRGIVLDSKTGMHD